MVTAIHNIESAMGSSVKKPSLEELKNRKAARKSIVAKRDIYKGEILTEENITTKRPGNGINPMEWFNVIGTYAVRDFMEDDKELLVARLTCGVVAAWGLLILNMLLRLKAKSIRAAMQAITENFSDWQGFLRRYWQQILYGGFWLLFSILMFAYRLKNMGVYGGAVHLLQCFL